jgi:serine/threonine protein kinase/tetratricopeptide (TPR) repeat protein
MRATNQPTWILVDDFVEAFEQARAADRSASLADYLPGEADPLYLPVLSELIRVDLESAWERGEPRRLESYRERFPRLFDAPGKLAEVAFEEFRLRHRAGDDVSVSEYEGRYGIDWPMMVTDQHPNRSPSNRSQGPCAPTDFPLIGSRFLDFRLISVLGQGGLGRVYLASQEELADRYVVLKITARHLAEPRALARLQHANIVPIYSIHRCGSLQAVCMPFFGATTLADVLREFAKRDRQTYCGRSLVDTVSRRQTQTQSAASRGMPASFGESVNEDDHTSASMVSDDASPNIRLLKDLSFVDAVLWIGLQISNGLLHAHERGIVHRDVKPANVLLSDDGQPMLLDFNLSADTTLAGFQTDPLIGGTLPYMAPEHLEALLHRSRHDDARSDIYSLGVVLYELLTGRLPFPVVAIDDCSLPDIIADRQRTTPSLPARDRVPAAAASIVARCLEGDVSKRYQSVAELREDLARQLESRSLKYAPERSWMERLQKWRRRHRQLASVTAVFVASACIIALLTAALIVRDLRLRRVAAVDSLQQFLGDAKKVQFELNQPDMSDRQIDAGTAHCREVLARYRIPDLSDWYTSDNLRLLGLGDRQKLGDTAVDLLALWARTLLQRSMAAPDAPNTRNDIELASRLNRSAQSWFIGRTCPRALLLQEADIAEQIDGPSADIDALRDDGQRLPFNGPADLVLEANDLIGKRECFEASRLLEDAILADPQHMLAWLALGHCRFQRGDFARAVACYGTCIALSPDAHWAWFDRGLSHLEMHDYKAAKVDFGRAIVLDAAHAEAWSNRGLAELAMGELEAAVADFTRALQLQIRSTRVYLMRARARELSGDAAGAAADLELGLQQQPTDETSWVARGVAKLRSDPQGALGDFEQALKLNPQSRAALEDKAHVLAELLGRPAEAVAALDRVTHLFPEYGAGYAGRGVLLARLGRYVAARDDARKAMLRDTSPPTVYRAACIYALASADNQDDQREALRLLSVALRAGFGLDVVKLDPDLAPLRGNPDFMQIVQAALALTIPSAESDKREATQDATRSP